MTRPSQHNNARYRVRLYVAGNSPRSQGAIRTVARLCEQFLGERLATELDLEIIDIYQQAERARADRIFAVPALVRERPGPPRRSIGRLSDDEHVIAALGLAAERSNGGVP
jgi:circadian clock protein KaiB